MRDELLILEHRINGLVMRGLDQGDKLGGLYGDLYLADQAGRRSDDIRDNLMELDQQFNDAMRDLYYSVVLYLEAKNLPAYLAMVKRRLGDDAPGSEQLSKFDRDEDAYMHRSAYLSAVQELLSGLAFRSDDTQWRQVVGIEYLERILKGTATLIWHSGISVTSEPDVYKAVRPTLVAVFPSSKDPGPDFSKIAKAYRADLAVPELGVAIEYKYADNETKLKNHFEQIAGDEKGYTEDHRYHTFYSVFYLTESFWTEERFKHAWKEHQYHGSWRPIYVLGSIGTKDRPSKK